MNHACPVVPLFLPIVTTCPFFPSSLLCNRASCALRNVLHMTFIMTFPIIQIIMMLHIILQIISRHSSLNRAYVHGCPMVSTNMFFIVCFVHHGFFCPMLYGTFHIIPVLFICSMMLINWMLLCLTLSLRRFHFVVFIVWCMILCMMTKIWLRMGCWSSKNCRRGWCALLYRF